MISMGGRNPGSRRQLSKARFITVTLSPLFERTLTTNYLATGYQNRTEGAERLAPSVQGVKVARVLHSPECDTQETVVLCNDLAGRAYRALVSDEGIGVTRVFLDGMTPSQTACSVPPAAFGRGWWLAS
jgi:fructose-1-phosphate kinase PfkB-like protein